MENPKLDLANKLKEASNVLVTVSRNPSVDQLSALIGLTLLLNKLSKHAAAIFSGEVPSTIEFLQPEKTIEKTTDSLRDFIIAIDKSKADKLRYKVEDNVVRIFITPFRTSISEADLEFSQGDFNVDVVVALGVKDQNDLDETITSHGRILHDATVVSINLNDKSELGGINWNDPSASSLSELVTELALELGKDLIDDQIATALLTGIVAETARFSNDKTSSNTMTTSSVLMAAGANQQLVASKLDQPTGSPANGMDTPMSINNDSAISDGSLSIAHDELPEPFDKNEDEMPESADTDTEKNSYDESSNDQTEGHVSDGPRIVTEPPSLGGALTANAKPEGLEPSSDPLSRVPEPGTQQLLKHNSDSEQNVTQNGATADQALPVDPLPSLSSPPITDPLPTPPLQPMPLPPTPMPASPPSAPMPGGQTLAELESSVKSPHIEAQEPKSSTDYDPAKFGITFEPDKPANGDQPPAGPLAAGPTQPNSPPPVPPPIPFQFGAQQKQ